MPDGQTLEHAVARLCALGSVPPEEAPYRPWPRITVPEIAVGFDMGRFSSCPSPGLEADRRSCPWARVVPMLALVAGLARDGLADKGLARTRARRS